MSLTQRGDKDASLPRKCSRTITSRESVFDSECRSMCITNTFLKRLRLKRNKNLCHLWEHEVLLPAVRPLFLYRHTIYIFSFLRFCVPVFLPGVCDSTLPHRELVSWVQVASSTAPLLSPTVPVAFNSDSDLFALQIWYLLTVIGAIITVTLWEFVTLFFCFFSLLPQCPSTLNICCHFRILRLNSESFLLCTVTVHSVPWFCSRTCIEIDCVAILVVASLPCKLIQVYVETEGFSD